MNQYLTQEEAKQMVGEGWGKLIDRLFEVFPGVQLIEVKEKFGGLRMYSWDESECVQDFIYWLEGESLNICEVCGEPGIQRGGGWVKTLCQAHAESLGYTSILSNTD